MIPTASFARTVRRALAQFAVLLLVVACAGHALASPILAVGDREVIYTTSQRRNLGLNFLP